MSLLSLLRASSATPPEPDQNAPTPQQTWPSSFVLPQRVGVEERAESNISAPYNASGPLVLPSPYTPPTMPSGTHPSVIDFGVQFNGYRWWMAYTPYPNGGDALENPVIVASNDRVNWVEPSGVRNPLEDRPLTGWNSDTELVWDNETHAMWCIYRVYREGNEFIRARRSYNGIDWSLPFRLFETGTTEGCLSPTVVKDHTGRWRMFSIGGTSYRTADHIFGPWSDPKPIKLIWADGVAGESPWHVFMRYEYGQYRMLLNGARGGGHLYPGVSEDGVNFRMGAAFLSSPASGWDSGGLYRSCMTPADNGADYDVWYATRGSGWQIGYTQVPRKHWWDL